MENKWRAARYGLDGKLIDFGKQRGAVRASGGGDISSSSTTSWTNSAAARRSGTSAGSSRRQRRRPPIARLPRNGRPKKVVDYIIERPKADCSKPRAYAARRTVMSASGRSTRLNSADAVDPEFARAPATPSYVCLRVQPQRRSPSSRTKRACEIAAAWSRELERSARPAASILEDSPPRPLVDMPRRDPRRHGDQPGQHLRGQGPDQRTAHAHADDRRGQPPQDAPRAHGQHRSPHHAGRHARRFREVDRISKQVSRMARRPRESAPPTPPAPTSSADLHPQLQMAQDQRHHQPEKWGNLPGGEIFTTPERVDGTFVIDGVVGDYLCEKYGDLAPQSAHHPRGGQPPEARRTPPTGTASASSGTTATPTKQRPRRRVRHRHQHRRPRRDRQHPAGRKDSRHSHRLRQSYGAHTGADWDSATHIDVVGRKFDIWVDGGQIMRDGKFLFEA